MRVGLLGDVHAEDVRLAAALRHLEGDVDAWWCVGDVLDGLGDERRTLALLRDVDAIVVRGNHERWMLETDARSSLSEDELDWIASWPTQVRFPSELGEILLCHGVGDDDMSLVLPGQRAEDARAIVDAALGEDPAALVVCGHTHVRMVRTLRGTHGSPRTLLNVGTLYRKDRAGFARLDTAAREVRFYDFMGDAVVEGPRFPLVG